MKDERLYQIIHAPHITEKITTVGEASNQYGFRVAPDATKSEIRKAVEFLFNVKVVRVTTLNVKAKIKRHLRRRGRISRGRHWKKAYVRLATGQDIDFTGLS